MLGDFIFETVGPFINGLVAVVIGVPGEALLCALTLGRRRPRYGRWWHESVEPTSILDPAFVTGIAFWLAAGWLVVELVR